MQTYIKSIPTIWYVRLCLHMKQSETAASWSGRMNGLNRFRLQIEGHLFECSSTLMTFAQIKPARRLKYSRLKQQHSAIMTHGLWETCPSWICLISLSSHLRPVNIIKSCGSEYYTLIMQCVKSVSFQWRASILFTQWVLFLTQVFIQKHYLSCIERFSKLKTRIKNMERCYFQN